MKRAIDESQHEHAVDQLREHERRAAAALAKKHQHLEEVKARALAEDQRLHERVARNLEKLERERETHAEEERRHHNQQYGCR